ncbi:ABC transporter permease [Bradyrhizobium sp.]|uniref:ABC transporter permease n=1 Tax=Bradyrhizobium sp. TaxID=376 RepID=UPI0040382877
MGKAVILPAPGSPFTVAFRDLAEAVGLAPVWLHAGWIDVVWRFRRTRLGPFWHTLNLAAFVVVIGVVWSAMLHQDPLSYFRYVTVSLVVWGLIASFITDGTGILIAGQSTALSMRFPYVAFALAHVWRALLLFAHHFAFYVVVMVGTQTSPGWQVLLAIPGLALIVANGVWMSLLSGIVCLRWRDMAQAISSAMQIAMFITPVFWPKTLLGPELAFAADLNPLYHLVQIMRDPLLGNVPPLESWLWASITFAVGAAVTMWVYGRNRDRLPYWY